VTLILLLCLLLLQSATGTITIEPPAELTPAATGPDIAAPYPRGPPDNGLGRNGLQPTPAGHREPRH
jgi:hypothetical protein